MKTPINYKLWLLKIGIALLSYPMLELLNPAKSTGRLNRETLHSTVETASWENFISGTFQESLTGYVNDQIGLFPFLVRLHNQLEYTLFGNVHAGKIIRGQENYLFEKGYVDSYYGTDLHKPEEIASFASTLKEFQDSMASKNKLVLYAMATGKANFYSEYLPKKAKPDSTNYEYYLNQFQKKGVNHIDFQPYFKELKKTFGKLLFPKYGIHWSHFSNVFVADTLVKYVEQKAGWDLPNIYINRINYTKIPRYFDNDLVGALNLFKEPSSGDLAYPEFEWRPQKSVSDSKKILIVGDSYAWDLVSNLRMGNECFEDLEFWYYNATAHKAVPSANQSKYSLPVLVRHRNLPEVLQEYDVFVILSNEPNLRMQAWGFPQWALKSITDSSLTALKAGEEQLLIKCYTKESWRADLEKLAAARGVTFDEMVQIYLHDKDFKF